MTSGLSKNLTTAAGFPRRIDDVGTTIETGPKFAEIDAEDPELDMKMPPDQRLAWDMVDAFRANYVKRHGHRPRAGVIKKRFDRFLAKVRASS